MSNKNQNNSISLFQVFDDICDKAVLNFNTNVNSYNYTDTSLDNCYVYSDIYNWKYDFGWLWTQPLSYTYKVETPSYPVSNYSVDKEGNSLIEIAVSGFESDEITVKREDLKIIVEGKKKEKEIDDRKYIYKHIAERDFVLEYTGSDKWDYDKLSPKISKGILSIFIPIKDDCKPVNRTYKIAE